VGMARKQTLQPKYPGDIGGDSKLKAVLGRRVLSGRQQRGLSPVKWVPDRGHLSNQKMLGGLRDSPFPTGLWMVSGVWLHIKVVG
jgi:hypothetical protein